MGVLQAIAVLDGALTIVSTISEWLEKRRHEVGELTPEEAKALDEYMEKKFAKWRRSA